MITAEQISAIFDSTGSDNFVAPFGSHIQIDGEWTTAELLAIARQIVAMEAKA